MVDKIIKNIHSVLVRWQKELISIFVTAIFAFRWRTCLPFSGNMPLANNTDQLDIWVRYVIWARESFSWPISTVHGLNFPFNDASITRGPMPPFAIFFKGLSKIWVSFSEFYYFIFAELTFVFVSAYFTCLLLELFHEKKVGIKIFGAVLVALSFPMLYRSSNYYGVTFLMCYIPLYLGFAYYYIKIYRNLNIKALLILAVFLAIMASFFEHYVFFGIYFLLVSSLSLCVLNHLCNDNRLNYERIKYTAMALFIGLFFSFSVVYMLGKQGDLDLKGTNSVSPLTGRGSNQWGYGGGFGGGFHVADVLTLIIPPKYDKNLPDYKWCGPSAYLTKMGFPLTTNSIQDGEYEGFSYLGTTTLGLLLVISIMGIPSLGKRIGSHLRRMRVWREASFRTKNEFLGISAIIGISAFGLFIMSLGYIVHIGGVRFNDIPTPSLILAMLLPKFMFVRTLGRLSIPFMLFITLVVIITAGRQIDRFLTKRSNRIKILYVTIICLLIGSHINEIKGYLEPPKSVIKGNVLAKQFSPNDVQMIQKVTGDKKAIITVPSIRDSEQWLKTCYSLAYSAQIPISGFYSGLAVSAEHINKNRQDVQNVISGNVKNIFDQYGNVAIAVSSKIADQVLKSTDVPLKTYRLENKDLVIMTL